MQCQTAYGTKVHILLLNIVFIGNIDIHNHVLVKKINETTRTSTMIFIKYIR